MLRSWLALRSDDKWSASRCGLAVPRQNGKNAILEMRELFGMIVLGEKFLHTAHEVKTARKAFIRLRSFFEDERKYPELAGLVDTIRQTNGQEAITLTTGGSVEFVARSKGSGRGFTVDVLVMDEAQDLTDDHIEALLPTISSAPLGNPQHYFTGTPPGPKVAGEIFTRVRADALEGKDKRLSWHEWSCPADADLDDPANLALANPGLGIRLQREVADAERGTLSDAGYGRERLGQWDEASSSRVIDTRSWSLSADTGSRPTERFALAVDVSPARDVASVAWAGQREDGDWHIELHEQRNSVDWVVPHIVERCALNDIRAVVIDGLSPAAALVDSLKDNRINVTVTGARDMANACGLFYDGINAGWLHHTDQVQLNMALGAARKRMIGDGGWGWNRKNALSDITALVACTLALWGAQSSSVSKPKRRQGSGKVVVLS